ncbi:unnamed protein product [Symbiodinium microadriaticum]|nr:unnamed protein product [Symbiodinium microadriaticum]
MDGAAAAKAAVLSQAQASRAALAGSYAELRSEGLRSWTAKTSKVLQQKALTTVQALKQFAANSAQKTRKSTLELAFAVRQAATARVLAVKDRVVMARSQVHAQASSAVVNAKAKALEVSGKAKQAAKDGHVQATAAGIAGGAATLGAAGGATGLASGVAVGAALGVVPALFTFGLSIPIGAAIGGGTGLDARMAFGEEREACKTNDITSSVKPGDLPTCDGERQAGLERAPNALEGRSSEKHTIAHLVEGRKWRTAVQLCARVLGRPKVITPQVLIGIMCNGTGLSVKGKNGAPPFSGQCMGAVSCAVEQLYQGLRAGMTDFARLQDRKGQLPCVFLLAEMFPPAQFDLLRKNAECAVFLLNFWEDIRTAEAEDGTEGSNMESTGLLAALARRVLAVQCSVAEDKTANAKAQPKKDTGNLVTNVQSALNYTRKTADRLPGKKGQSELGDQQACKLEVPPPSGFFRLQTVPRGSVPFASNSDTCVPGALYSGPFRRFEPYVFIYYSCVHVFSWLQSDRQKSCSLPNAAV